jgi:hypothetical protein
MVASRQPSNHEAAGVVVMNYGIWGDGRSGGAVIGGAFLLDVVIEPDTSDHLREPVLALQPALS